MEQTIDINTVTLFQPQRLENETVEAYRERRLVSKYKSHIISNGKLIWNSRKQGTYRKSKNGEL